MKTTLLATAALGLFGAGAAVGAPLAVPGGSADDIAAAFLEGGMGGPSEPQSGSPEGGLLFVHHKHKHKHRHWHWYEGGEGGEGGEGRPVIIHRPVVHYVPLIPAIVRGPIAIVLEADLPFFVDFEPRIVAAPIGTVIPWSNPDTGHYGEVAVLDDGYDDASGLPCRTYRTTVVIDGQPETATGTACREPDGSWRIVN